jgi:hypothetical protein
VQSSDISSTHPSSSWTDSFRWATSLQLLKFSISVPNAQRQIITSATSSRRILSVIDGVCRSFGHRDLKLKTILADLRGDDSLGFVGAEFFGGLYGQDQFSALF